MVRKIGLSFSDSPKVLFTFARMEKKLFVLMAGLAAAAAPAFARFHTVARIPGRCKVEVVKTASDGDADEIAGLTADLLPKTNGKTSETAACDDAYKKKWTDRFLSVCYPLRHIRINSPFGYRTDPFTGKRKYHNGLDLHARGDEVFAMMDGIVVRVGQDNASGKYVTLRHGNCTVSYCHLSRTVARKGDAVKAGTVVGITGSTGRSTGEHLHITCKFNGKDIDPLLLLDFIKTTREECVAALVKGI